MRSRSAILVVATIAVLAAGGIFTFRQRLGLEAPQSPPAAPPAVPVVAAKVTSSNLPIYLRGVGTVIAYNTVTVHSQIQGQITQIAFTEGQAVKAGDLLAQIDPRLYQAQIDQLTANLYRDQAQLTNASANLDRYNSLMSKGYATTQLVETQKAQVAQLQSAIKADDALVEAAKVQMDYTRLTSPIAGITGIRQIDTGNVIYPSSTTGLVVVTQVEPISVIFTLPETDLPKIQQQIAKGPITILAYSQDDKIKLDEGTLGLVNNQILQTTGTIQLKASFPNAAHRLWPGGLINVRLLLETQQDALTVAASAVQQGPQGAYVYVIAPDGTAQMRPVTVAQISAGDALIDQGLAANETVVVDGQYRLKPGVPVQVLHGQAAKQADLQSAVQEAIP